MSKEGMLHRGEQYWDHRDRDGKLPIGISSNEAKMVDVNYYLDSIKKEEPKKPEPKKKEGVK